MGLTAAEFIRQQTQERTQRETEQKILIKQMEVKLGSVPPRVYQAIQAIADVEKLGTLLYRIPVASSLAEMESLLNGATSELEGGQN